MAQNHEPEPHLRPLASEQLLIDHLPPIAEGGEALVVSPGRAQLATHLLARHRCSSVQAWYLDLHDASQISGHAAEEGLERDASKVEVLCGAELPTSQYSLVAIPTLRRGETELTRDLLQQGHQRLEIGGFLAASVDNPKDSWLHGQLQAMLDKVTCKRTKRGCIYWGKKTSELKKTKDFECKFAFRDADGRLITVFSRPGVFSHRRLDPGARQLMLCGEIGPQDNVLDMGCGAGAVALAAAFQTHGAVFGVDSNARAIACLKRGAEINGLANISPVWNADGQIELPMEIDIALANPPYFGNDTIGQHFVETAVRSLRSGGALLLVTKKPNWYAAYFDQILEDVTVIDSARYFVVCGRKP